MLRDYELALSNYRLISTDYKIDKAWKRYAGVQVVIIIFIFQLQWAFRWWCMVSRCFQIRLVFFFFFFSFVEKQWKDVDLVSISSLDNIELFEKSDNSIIYLPTIWISITLLSRSYWWIYLFLIKYETLKRWKYCRRDTLHGSLFCHFELKSK